MPGGQVTKMDSYPVFAPFDTGARYMKMFALFGRPSFLKAFHGWCTAVWAVLIPLTVITDLKASIVWIALMSVWANFVGHFSSWQATRVEVKQEEEIMARSNDV